MLHCATKLHVSMDFITLINVKIPTIVGIIAIISRIKTTSKGLKERRIFILQQFSFMSS